MSSPVIFFSASPSDRADAAQLLVAVRVGLPVLDDLAADHLRAFGDRHHGVVAGIVPLILHQKRRQFLRIEMHLGNDRSIDAGQIRREQTGLAAVATEQLHHGDALVAARAGAQLVDEFHTARDGGGKADAVISAEDVVVHRLGNGDDVHAFAMQPLGIAQRVVAADRHQRPDAQFIQHLQHVRREIEWAVVVWMRLALQERRHLGRADFAGIGAAGVQERAARAIDRADALLVQRQNVLR